LSTTAASSPAFTEAVERRLLEGLAQFLGEDGAAGENGDVLQHALATIAEALR
jgi:hypothetical protein